MPGIRARISLGTAKEAGGPFILKRGGFDPPFLSLTSKSEKNKIVFQNLSE